MTLPFYLLRRWAPALVSVIAALWIGWRMSETSPQAVPWNARVFGRLELEHEGVSTTKFRSERARALLARLLIAPGREMTREELASLWEDELTVGRPDPARAFRNLSRELVDLRKLLNRGTIEVLRSDSRRVWLDGGAIRSDMQEFRRHLACARKEPDPLKKREFLRQAVDLYETSGPLLPGMYDEWIVTERHLVENDYQDAKEQYRRLMGADAPSELGDDDLALLLRNAKLRMAEEARTDIGTGQQAKWFAKFDDDSKVVLWLLEQELKTDQPPQLIRNAALRRYWQQKANPGVMRDYLVDLLANTRSIARTPLPFCQMLIAFLSVSIGDHVTARRFGDPALIEFRRRRDAAGEGGMLCTLAWEAAARGDHAASGRLNDEAVAAYERLGDDLAVCSALQHAADAYSIAGNPNTALARCQVALRIARAHDLTERQVSLLLLQSRILALSGRLSEAQQTVARAAMVLPVGNQLNTSIDALITRSGIAECGGRRAEALALYSRTLALTATMNDRANFVGRLESLLRGALGHPLHEWTNARPAFQTTDAASGHALAELTGFVSSSRRKLGLLRSIPERRKQSDVEDCLRSLLGKEAFDRAHASGQKLEMAASARMAERLFCK